MAPQSHSVRRDFLPWSSVSPYLNARKHVQQCHSDHQTSPASSAPAAFEKGRSVSSLETTSKAKGCPHGRVVSGKGCADAAGLSAAVKCSTPPLNSGTDAVAVAGFGLKSVGKGSNYGVGNPTPSVVLDMQPAGRASVADGPIPLAPGPLDRHFLLLSPTP